MPVYEIQPCSKCGAVETVCRMSNMQKDEQGRTNADFVPDIEEFGSCYCNLYVSKEWNEGEIPHEYVPERRPPEKIGL